ncbi:MAG: dynamin family protein [Gemmatimonadetes bacterium]|nr:dynamin family protein [Gemmatimonadota bacterium]
MEISIPREGSGAGTATAPEAVDAGVRGPAEPPSGHSSTHLVRGLTQLARLAERFGDGGVAEGARAALRPLEENLLRMVALGQFKRGKSTLLNALLDADLLPSGIAPVTSVSTVVRWSPTPCLTVFYAGGDVETADIARLSDFVVEERNPGNALGVSLVEVGYPSELLEDGLVLVDTPGIGSTDRAATERAYGFLPSVDAGLVVLSPDPPVGEAEAAYIRECATLTPHLLFVLNKIDRVSEAEWREILSFNRTVLADVLQRAPDDVHIVPVSARAALQGGDRRVEALRARIQDFIAQKGVHVREQLARRRMHAAAVTLRARLEVERQALDMEGAELDERIQGLRETLGSLTSRADRASRAVMAAVDESVGRAGDAMLAHARSKRAGLSGHLVSTVQAAPRSESNASVATIFDDELQERTWAVLDAWWSDNGSQIVRGLLEEINRVSDELVAARREAAEWIQEAFGVELPEEPRVEALKESGNFYRRVEGVTPRLTLDLLRALLPRGMYRAWIRRSVPKLAARALDMGAGQVRGDMFYRARETARAFTSELRTWTLAGTEGLMDGVRRAADLQLEARVTADDRRRELDDGLAELRRLSESRS